MDQASPVQYMGIYVANWYFYWFIKDIIIFRQIHVIAFNWGWSQCNQTVSIDKILGNNLNRVFLILDTPYTETIGKVAHNTGDHSDRKLWAKQAQDSTSECAKLGQRVLLSRRAVTATRSATVWKYRAVICLCHLLWKSPQLYACRIQGKSHFEHKISAEVRFIVWLLFQQ